MRRLAGGLAGAVIALLPVVVLAFTTSPNDPYYRAGYQWALSGNASSTNAPNAWCSSTGGGILVADIDTGADFTHPDLQGKLVAGANFTSGNANPGPDPQPDATGQAAVMDDYGHGTMTTGIIAAATDNGVGIAAEAPGARALVMKVFSNKGGTNGYSAYNTDVAAAIYWSVEHGARVINLSLGPVIPDPVGVTGDPIPGAVQWAASQNVGVAIAAGNGFFDLGATAPGQPAAYPQLAPYALNVGAMGPSGQRASYSQSGAGVNIFAPGGDGGGGDPHADILSTYPSYTPQNGGMPRNVSNGPYALYDGTSFSTPYAAGTLALLMAKGLSATQARNRIIGTAKTVGGLPVLDAKAAVGACGTGSSAGTTSTSSSGVRAVAAGAAPPAAGKLPSAAPPSAGASPGRTPAPDTAGTQAAANPAVVHADEIRRIPTPVAALLVIVGTACVAGAAIWFFRSRVFTQP
jgi:serine protease